MPNNHQTLSMTLDQIDNNWLQEFKNPLVVAGPCSAESESQLLEIAEQLDPNYTQIFRAGIWKPRTKPGNFEGVGSIGLKWLQKVKEEYSLPVSTEVANAQHVKEALEHGIDYLWVGARTTVNPFAVQEIADALQGIDIPVLVKNPINPDLELWIGALERLAGAGISRLGAIHRGFSTYNKTQYRNNPKWQIPLELRRRFPNIPLISDPSHIGGRRDLIEPISKKAFNLHFDGLMVETHCHPDEAWSDAKQQITPARLLEILKDIRLKDYDKEDDDYHLKINKLREEIDHLDEEIWHLFENRMKVAEQIGALKKEYNIAIYQPDRWKDIVEKAKEERVSPYLSEEFVDRVTKAIHQQSLEVQNKVINR